MTLRQRHPHRHATREARIERSTGIVVPGWYGPNPGGGYEGKTALLDEAVAREAQKLSRMWGTRDVQIRFNADRESGGAFIRNRVPGIAGNSQVGIGVREGPVTPNAEPFYEYADRVLGKNRYDLPDAEFREQERKRHELYESLPKTLIYEAHAAKSVLRDPSAVSIEEGSGIFEPSARKDFHSPAQAEAWLKQHVDPKKIKR